MKWRLLKNVIVVNLIMLSGIWGWNQCTLLQQTNNDKSDSFSVLQSISSPQADAAIAVDNNSDLVDQAELYGWDSGGRDGSSKLPYAIWLKTITTGISSKLISILNTDLYIDIFSCTLTGEDYGIYLENVTNCLIRDNLIQDSVRYGIRIMDGSSNVNITANTITSTLSNTGVGAFDSSQILISGNTISSNGDGVALSSSNHTLVDHNTIQNNKNNGIYTNFAYYNTISDNTINSSWNYQAGTYGNGMRIVNSVNTSISKNTVHSNVGSGIIIYSTTYNTTIIGNEIYNHTENSGSSGIEHWGSTYNSTISNNLLYDNRYGIGANDWHIITNNTINTSTVTGISLDSWNIVNNNTLTDNNEGIDVGDTHNSLSYNEIYNSTTVGINLDSAFDTILVHNTIENSGNYGIRFYQTQRTTMKDNILVNNTLSIFGFIYAHYAQAEVSNNLLNGNPLIFWKNMNGPLTVPSYAEEVFIFNCTNIEIANLHLTDVYSGITVHSSNNLSIHDNTISSCVYSALDIHSTNNSRISNNTFSDTGQVIKGNNIENLTVTNNLFLRNSGSTAGIIDLSDISNSIISENEFYDNKRWAIAIISGYYNTIKSNIIHNQSTAGGGIFLQNQVNTTVYWNSITNCSDYGIQVWSGSNNSIFTNEINNSTEYGVHISISNWNVVMFNNFSNNNIGNSQAYDAGLNNLFSKNYWNDEVGTDDDEDGYLDGNTYSLDGGANFDPILLANPYSPTFPVINYPNGGETLSGNVTILWTTASDLLNNLFTYSLYYSLDNGVSWVEIAKDLDVTSYLWNTLALTNSSNYLLKVTAFYQEVTYNQGGIILEDVSDDFFAIQNVAHYLTAPVITFPTSGDVVSDFITIQWTASTDTWSHDFSINYDVFYSKDGGNTWNDISSTSSTNVAWDTSFSEGLNYRIKINATSDEGLTSEFITQTFIVQNHALSIPTVLYPNGGEILSDSINILWTTSTDSSGHPMNYSIFYSEDGGSSWEMLESGLVTNESVWDTTLVPDGSNYIIKVVVTDELGFTNENSSGSSFTILNAELPTTTLPTTPSTSPAESTSETTTKSSTETSTTQEGSAPGWTGYSLLFILGVITLIRRRKKQ